VPLPLSMQPGAELVGLPLVLSMWAP